MPVNKYDYQYLYSTVLIEAITTNNTCVRATGFYFNFEEIDGDALIGIVSNKHVFENISEATIKIVLCDKDGTPDDANPTSYTVNCFDDVIGHPDESVDLCMIPLASIADGSELPEGREFCIHPFSEKDFLDEALLEELSAVEDVIMIGYPDGLIDETNYKPIIRKGITATHIKLDYEGQTDFLIDMCCFAGSSGSPVFLYKYGIFEMGGDTFAGLRTKLIGVLYEGYDVDVNGKLIKTEIKKISVPSIKMHLNIGIVLKAIALTELKHEVLKRLT